MTRLFTRLPFALLLASVFLIALAAPSAAQSGGDDDDHSVLKPAEPDYTIVNLPTTLPLPKYKGNFHLTHRFNGNLRGYTFGENASNLFGLDQGAAMSFEYRFGVTKHLEAITQRTNIGKVIQFSAKYDALHQVGASPVAISGIAAVEGENNFKLRRSPSLGVVVSRAIHDSLAVYAVPFWTHRNAGGIGDDHNVFVLGLGARARVRPALYLVGEVSPRVAGFAAGDAEYGVGVETRVGGHVFQLTFTNNQAVTFGQLAGGGTPKSLFLGFNLARKFF